jgi:PAS domain S-box-containing protein
MPTLTDDPELFRSVLENLPIGVYILDRERRFLFWNRGAEQITGYLAHEVIGQSFGAHVLVPCDLQGRVLSENRCPVTAALDGGHAEVVSAFYLHKQGHRLAVETRTAPMFDRTEFMTGVTVVFQEVSAAVGEDTVAPLMLNCLDATTGVPSHRLTRAVLTEFIAVANEAHGDFGLLKIRVSGLEGFSAKHGPDSVAAFLRTTAQTLRHSLDPGSFLGCWGEDGFVAVLDTASPAHVAATAESIRRLLGQSEIVWWGDRFVVEAEVGYALAHAGDSVATLLKEMKPRLAVKAASAGEGGPDSGSQRG